MFQAQIYAKKKPYDVETPFSFLDILFFLRTLKIKHDDVNKISGNNTKSSSIDM